MLKFGISFACVDNGAAITVLRALFMGLELINIQGLVF